MIPATYLCREPACFKTALPGFRGYCGEHAARAAERNGGVCTVEMFPELAPPAPAEQGELFRERG